jgi:hypothetical protein
MKKLTINTALFTTSLLIFSCENDPLVPPAPVTRVTLSESINGFNADGLTFAFFDLEFRDFDDDGIDESSQLVVFVSDDLNFCAKVNNSGSLFPNGRQVGVGMISGIDADFSAGATFVNQINPFVSSLINSIEAGDGTNFFLAAFSANSVNTNDTITIVEFTEGESLTLTFSGKLVANVTDFENFLEADPISVDISGTVEATFCDALR